MDENMSGPGSGDSFYTSGTFHAHSEGGKDAEYKVRQMRLLLDRVLPATDRKIAVAADVGCGSGHTTLLLQKMLGEIGCGPARVEGYDLHPGMQEKSGNENVSFFRRDFRKESGSYDLIFLLDVIEHVTSPIDFLRAVSGRSRYVVLHIPLDDSWMVGLRNLGRRKLTHPGHLIQLNTASALNLCCYGGLRVIDYEYSPVFLAPTGRKSKSQLMLQAIRKGLYSISPYLLQRTLGGASLSVIARGSMQAEL